MGKRWKNIRAALAGVGYTSVASAANVTITSMDADGTLYYTDENGDAVKVLYPSATPIVVNSDTSTITVTLSSVYLAGISGYTTTATVVNENSLNVASECTFTSSNIAVFTTGGTYGATLTARGSGTSILTVVHNDGVTISGTTTITVGPFVDGLLGSPSATTIITGTTYSATGWTNLLVQNIPYTQLTLTANVSTYGVFSGTTGVFYANSNSITGTTIITATDGITQLTGSTTIITRL